MLDPSTATGQADPDHVRGGDDDERSTNGNAGADAQERSEDGDPERPAGLTRRVQHPGCQANPELAV